MSLENQDYRESRIKVSYEIKRKLQVLVEKEKDFERVKIHPAKWYRDEVSKLLNLEESQNPSLRSYEEALKPIRIYLKKNNMLDNGWTTHACLQNNIPADFIPTLIQMKQIGLQITTRQAKWGAYLQTSIKILLKNQTQSFTSTLLWSLLSSEQSKTGTLSESSVKTFFKLLINPLSTPDDLAFLEPYCISMIASQYASLDQFAEINKSKDIDKIKLNVDISRLDEMFFIKEDLSIFAFANGAVLMAENDSKKLKAEMLSKFNDLKKFNFFTQEQAKAQFGELTQDKFDLINEFIRVFLTGELSKWSEQNGKKVNELKNLMEVKTK